MNDDLNNLTDEQAGRLMDEAGKRSRQMGIRMTSAAEAKRRCEVLLQLNNMSTDELLGAIRNLQKELDKLHESLEAAEHILDGRARHGVSQEAMKKLIMHEIRRAESMLEKKEVEKELREKR